MITTYGWHWENQDPKINEDVSRRHCNLSCKSVRTFSLDGKQRVEWCVEVGSACCEQLYEEYEPPGY